MWRNMVPLAKYGSLLYLFTFNIVITHEIITFQEMCMDKIPKDFTSIKDTYYAALTYSNTLAAGIGQK